MNDDSNDIKGMSGSAQANPTFGRAGPEQVYSPGTTQRPVSPDQAIDALEAAQPPQRSRHAKNRFVVFFNFLMSSVVLSTLAVLAVLYFGKLTFNEPGPLDSPKSVVVKEGWSLAKISSDLQARGIIESDLVFRMGVRAYRAQSQMKAGEYAFKPGMSMLEVMETLRSGKGVVYKVSIPEGLTTLQIIERLAKDEVLIGDLPDELPPEGSLMPDTYPFQRGLTRKELIAQMMRVQEKFLNEVWERRVKELPIKSKEELLTLASIVEKETAKASERPHVASVFINRLNRGMRLQSDPTIIYGLFGGKGKPKDRPIYRSDITKPTDYNTYVIPSLPPGPIANPGRASLEAVANPSQTLDLYFVADGTGGHAFAQSLAEHEANVVRWRAIEKRVAEEAKKKAAEAQAIEEKPAAPSN